MRNEFTAIVEVDGPWHIACCRQVPGTSGQGRTKDEAFANLAGAIELILLDHRGRFARATGRGRAGNCDGRDMKTGALLCHLRDDDGT